jgi:lipopolysaccharide export LptBFGC system permease protein LptF
MLPTTKESEGFNMAEDNKRVGTDFDENHAVDPNLGANTYSDYTEETAAEVVPPFTPVRESHQTINTGTDTENNTGVMGGTGLGWLALALSIISLFVMPVLMGAAGIIIGFIARRRGATGIGTWAIGIGVVSIVLGIFILPFF